MIPYLFEYGGDYWFVSSEETGIIENIQSGKGSRNKGSIKRNWELSTTKGKIMLPGEVIK